MNATLKIRKQTPRSAPETGEQIVDHWRIAPRVIVGTHCPAQQGLPEMRALKGPMTRLNSDRGSQPVDKARLISHTWPQLKLTSSLVRFGCSASGVPHAETEVTVNTNT